MDTVAQHLAGHVARDVPVSEIDPADPADGSRRGGWSGYDDGAKLPPPQEIPPTLLGRAGHTDTPIFLRELDPGQQYELTGAHGRIAAEIGTPDGELTVWGTPIPLARLSPEGSAPQPEIIQPYDQDDLTDPRLRRGDDGLSYAAGW